MEYRRVIFPSLNLDFESPVNIVPHIKPLTPTISVPQNQKCSHHESMSYPLSNTATCSTFTVSVSPEDLNLSERSDDQSEELKMIRKTKYKKHKNFTRVTKQDVPLDLLHQSCTPSKTLRRNSKTSHLNNGMASFAPFVLKSKSPKIASPQRDAEVRTKPSTEVTNKLYGSRKNSNINQLSSGISLSKVDINGNDLEYRTTNSSHKDDKPVPLVRTTTYEVIKGRDENNLETIYIPPPPILMKRMHLMGYDSETEENDSDDAPCEALQLSKVGVDEDDPNSFRPPRLPSPIQQKLLQTIKSMKYTKELDAVSPPMNPVNEDHGQGESLQVNNNNQEKISSQNIHQISFHYETKDGNLDTLKGAGFSVNFHYPYQTEGQPNLVSTYFPGARVSRSQTNVIPVPEFMKQDFGSNEKNLGKNNSHIMWRLKKLGTSLSNLSMTPMMYTEKGSSPQIQEFIVGGNLSTTNRLGNTLKKKLVEEKNSIEKKNIIPWAPNKLGITPVLSSELLEVHKSHQSRHSRPLTRRRSCSITHFKKNLSEPKKIFAQKISRATPFLIRRPSSTGSVNMKSVSSVDFLRFFNIRSLRPNKHNSNLCSFPKIYTPPSNHTYTIHSDSPSSQEDLILSTEPGGLMPSTTKTVGPNSKGRVAKKVNAKLEKGHREQDDTSAASEGGRTPKKGLRSTSKPLKSKKLKHPAINDPYYLNSTASEKEIIKELVRADVDAMLERDAVALLTLDEDVQEELPPVPPTVAATPVQSRATWKGPAIPRTHWSWRAKDDPNAIKSAPGNQVKLFAGAGPKNKPRPGGGTVTSIKGKKIIPSPSISKSKRK